jgi:hypothetical protein
MAVENLSISGNNGTFIKGLEAVYHIPVVSVLKIRTDNKSSNCFIHGFGDII